MRYYNLPNKSNFTSLAAFSPSSRRFLSIIFDLSAAALSSALTVQPIASNAGVRRPLSQILKKKKASVLIVLVCQPMPGITTRWLLLPAMPSYGKENSRFQSCYPRVKSQCWRSDPHTMLPNHFFFHAKFQAVTGGPFRNVQRSLSIIHSLSETTVLAVP